MYFKKITIMSETYAPLKRLDNYKLSLNLGKPWVYKNK